MGTEVMDVGLVRSAWGKALLRCGELRKPGTRSLICALFITKLTHMFSSSAVVTVCAFDKHVGAASGRRCFLVENVHLHESFA